MADLEDALRIRHFHRLPSSEEFSAEIEPSNVPAVFYDAIKGWEAISRWNPSDGGLDYLQERAGSVVVEAMLSKSAPVFYGDLRSHERVPVPFSAFITSCKSYQKEVGTSNRQEVGTSEERASSLDNPDLIYLAQVPILNAKIKETCPLEILRGDLEMPNFLGNNAVESINLWMNRASSRSSTHYDPHHNLLCVVAGCKRVVLWPPSSSPLLYPMPIYGEASNHSAVDLINPDFSVHIRAVNSKEYSQEIILHHGDALFIPEGWYHQVDSHDLTVAVNFWWKSSTISNMVEHMDAYYLRRILNRLVDKEMNVMLKSLEDCSKSNGDHFQKIDVSKGDSHLESNDHKMYAEQNSKQFALASDQLGPVELNVLYEIVSLVHENFGRSSHDEASGFTPKMSGANVEGDQKSTVAGSSSPVLNNPIASILWAVDPLVLQKVLLSMVNRFPRTLEALIIHMLSPAAAEVLTRKFDQMDREATNEQQSEFYRQFYSVFDDQYAAMDSILHGKESFSFQAFCNVVDKYLGVSVDQDRSYHLRGRFR